MPLQFPEILTSFIKQNRCNLYELRIRNNKPIIANLNGEYAAVTYKGNNIILTSDQIKKIVLSACENSIYAYNESIKKGYVTTAEGIRLGICGKCVYSGKDIATITDFSSLCIRFPNEVVGCANVIFDKIRQLGGIKNTLIISPPGVGKTTVLRDLARILSADANSNLLIIDEKEEIYRENYTFGISCDVLVGCSKRFGFYNGIKNLCPKIIIVDELSSLDDVDGIEFAILSGVTVIASAHGDSFYSCKQKKYLCSLIEKGLFECFITLKKHGRSFNISEVIDSSV